jgi:UDP-N-acetylmuramoyl-tripeptide--D-alanyl-D-alanine ligase
LFKLLEAQLGKKAFYSHEANSAFGIPFNILGLQRKNFLFYEYVVFALKAPFLAYSRVSEQSLYIAECDTDRPGEGQFLADLLRPDYTLWLNSTLTHGMNFDYQVKQGSFADVEEAIAADFGQLILGTKRIAWANGDDKNVVGFLQKNQPKCQIVNLHSRDYLQGYEPTKKGTKFILNGEVLKIGALLPQKASLSLVMIKELLKELDEARSFDPSFAKFELEPGRSGLFEGVKETVLLDSTYNASWDGMQEMLGVLEQFAGQKKWVVLGDMLEQGESTQQTHEQLARKLVKMNLEKVVLVGRLTRQYTYPILAKKYGDKVSSALRPSEVVDDLKAAVVGGEVILFKGGRFLDGLVEELLLDKKQAKHLVRREPHWHKVRAKMY